MSNLPFDPNSSSAQPNPMDRRGRHRRTGKHRKHDATTAWPRRTIWLSILVWLGVLWGGLANRATLAPKVVHWLNRVQAQRMHAPAGATAVKKTWLRRTESPSVASPTRVAQSHPPSVPPIASTPVTKVKPVPVSATKLRHATHSPTLRVNGQPAENVAPVPIVWFGSPIANRIYITMDDGWYPEPKVIQLMKQDHVPITTFLIQDAAKEHLSFWKQFIAAGGTVEDHTVDHPDLTKISFIKDVREWRDAKIQDAAWFGSSPTLGRPPYGALSTQVRRAADAAGLKSLVMWSATFAPGKKDAVLQTYDGKPLRAGEIVLLHWDPGVAGELKQLLAVCKANHLVPASLMAGLPVVDK